MVNKTASWLFESCKLWMKPLIHSVWHPFWHCVLLSVVRLLKSSLSTWVISPNFHSVKDFRFVSRIWITHASFQSFYCSVLLKMSEIFIFRNILFPPNCNDSGVLVGSHAKQEKVKKSEKWWLSCTAFANFFELWMLTSLVALQTLVFKTCNWYLF